MTPEQYKILSAELDELSEKVKKTKELARYFEKNNTGDLQLFANTPLPPTGFFNQKDVNKIHMAIVTPVAGQEYFEVISAINMVDGKCISCHEIRPNLLTYDGTGFLVPVYKMKIQIPEATKNYFAAMPGVLRVLSSHIFQSHEP